VEEARFSTGRISCGGGAFQKRGEEESTEGGGAMEEKEVGVSPS